MAIPVPPADPPRGAAVVLVVLGSLLLVIMALVMLPFLYLLVVLGLGGAARDRATLFFLAGGPGLLMFLAGWLAVGAALVGGGLVYAARRLPPERSPEPAP